MGRGTIVTNPLCCLSTIGSSKGRGYRAAGWFDDLIKDRTIEEISSIVLTDGIADWANAGQDYVSLMEEYKADTWGSPKQEGK